MATFLHSPMSPPSARAFSFQHMSIATTIDVIKCAEDNDTIVPSPQNKISETSRPLSRASTSKSQLRRSNEILTETLESIKRELGHQRTIMLSLQTRILQIECESHSAKMVHPTQRKISIQGEDGSPPSSNMSNITRESQTWWEACQNFAHNCDTPFNATEFLKTPQPLSGFDFNFGVQDDYPGAPPGTPALEDVPGLTPSSLRDEQSNKSLKESFKAMNRPFPLSNRSTSPSEAGSDIVERIVEFDRVRIPAPPILQTPPRSIRSKPESVMSVEEDITALPSMPPRPESVERSPKRQHGRIKSLFMYKALLRTKTSDRGMVYCSTTTALIMS